MKTVRNKSIIACLLLLFSGAWEATAQQTRFDSLVAVISQLEGQQKVEEITNLLSVDMEKNEADYLAEYPEQSLGLLEEALAITKELELPENELNVHAQLQRYYNIQGDFPNELNHLFLMLESINAMSENQTFDEAAKKRERAEVYVLVGNSYKDKGNLTDALKYYLKARSEFEEAGEKSGQVVVSGSIGLIYLKEEKYASAEEEFMKAVKIAQSLEDSEEQLAITYSNLGRTKAYQKDFAKANEYLTNALEIDRELGDEYGMAYDYFNLAEVMEMQNANSPALRYLQDAYQVFEMYGDEPSMAACQILEGKIYRKQKLYSRAQQTLDSALSMANNLGIKPIIKEAYEQLYHLYDAKGNPPQAFDYYKKFVEVRDEITNSQISETIENLRNSYEVQKKAEQIETLEQEKAKERKLKNMLILVSILGAIISFGFIVSMYKRYKLKQQANDELAEKNQLIAHANEKVTGSIRYGRRIQKALLASGDQIQNSLPESFIFLKPKDIVTGDFYWYANQGDFQILAAIDCTGHGVPGAFMTVFGYSLLNKIVNNDRITEPSEILEALGIEVMRLFQTKDEGQIIQDGMDMALVKIDHKNKQLQYAGANRPLVLHTQDGQQYIRGDKVGLGGKVMVERGKSFTTHVHHYAAGDTFYIFSDGFQDQFGGPEGRKYMSKRFRKFLAEIQPLSMSQQYETMQQEIQEWMGEEKQTDDMIVIGVRLEE